MQLVYKSAFSEGHKTVEMAQMELEADEMDFGPPTNVVSSGRRASVSRPMISTPLLAIPTKLLGATPLPSSARALHTSTPKFPSSSPPSADVPRVRRSSTSAVERPVSTIESLAGAPASSSSTPRLVDIANQRRRNTPITFRPRNSAPADPASRNLGNELVPDSINNIIKTQATGKYSAVQDAVRRYIAVESHYSIDGHNLAMGALLSTRPPNDPIDSVVQLYTQVFDHPRLHPTGETYAHIIRAFCSRDEEVGRAIILIQKRTLKKQLANDARGPFHAVDEGDNNQLEQERVDIARLQKEDYFSPALAIYQALGPKADDLPFSAINGLIAGATRRRRVDLALSLFGRIETSGRPVATNYANLIAMYGVEKDKEGVSDVFEAYLEARVAGMTLPSKRPDLASPRFDRLPTKHRYSTEGNYVPSKMTFTLPTDGTLWAKTIEALFRCGDDVAAIGLVERIQSALESAKSLKKPVSRGYPDALSPVIFKSVITGFTGQGDTVSAQKWFDQAMTLFEGKLETPFFYDILFRALDARSISFANHVYRTMFPLALADVGPVSTLIDANLAAAYATTEESLRQEYIDAVIEFKASFIEARDQGRSILRYASIGTGGLMRIVFALAYHQRWNQISVEYADLAKAILWATNEKGGMRGPARWLQLIQEYQLGALGAKRLVDRPSWDQFELPSSTEPRPPLPVALDILASTSLVTESMQVAPDVRVCDFIVNLYAEGRSTTDPKSLNLTGTQWFYTVFAHATVAGTIPKGYQPSPTFTGVEPIVEDFVASEVTLPSAETLDYRGLVVSLQEAGMEKKRILAILSHLDQSIADDLINNRNISKPVQLETPPSSPPSAVPFLESTRPIDPADALAASRSAENLPTPPSTPPTYISEAGPASFVNTPIQRIDAGLNAAAGRLISQPDSGSALSLLVTNANEGLFAHPDTVGHLVELLGREGKVDAARQAYLLAYAALGAMGNDPESQSISWVLLEDRMIIALAQAGALSEVTVHRERLLAAGSAPSADGYAAMILNMNETTDDASVALELFDESQRFNVTPNVYLFNTLISKLSRARRAKDALDYFELMKTCGLRPSSITYGAVINACCKTGDGSTADYLFEEMVKSPGFRPRVPPYNTMIQFYTQTQPDRTRALYFYDQLLKAGIRPTGHTYKLLLDVYGSVGEPDTGSMTDVFDLLVSDPQVSVTGAHWASLINAWGCVGKDLERAVAIFDSIGHHPSTKASGANLPDAVVYESLLNAFLANQRPDLCEKYLEQMQIKGVRMTAYVANTLIKGHASQNNMEAARKVFESLTDPPSGVAAAGNHTTDRHPRHQQGNSSLSPNDPIYREPSTWEIMVRSEIAAGEPQRAGELMKRIELRAFPEAVVERIRKHLTDSGMGDL